MKYATQYYMGNNPNTGKRKTKKIVPAVERICTMDAADKRRPRNKQRQEEISTATNAANGFLNTTFLPKLQKNETLQTSKEVEKIETGFYTSLCEAARHYNGFEPTDTRLFGYPYNLVLSVWELQNHLKQKVKDYSNLHLVQDGEGKAFLISTEQYDTGTNLYYIPVMPLYKMLHNKKTRKAACLLLSVFAYLYHVADIPYYRQQSSYTYWQYEMLSEWIEQDEVKEYTDNDKRQFQIAAWVGDRIERKLFNRKNIEVFAERIRAFAPKTVFDTECLALAIKCFSLYKDYPETNIFINACIEDEDIEQSDEIIAMTKYISFIADDKGWLYEMLAECVNNEFNECGKTEEPAILKKFDGSSNLKANLDFENRLFPLIEDLCRLLAND